MLSSATALAAIKAIQVYGVAIIISMVVAIFIKLLVVVTGRVNKPAVAAAPVQKISTPEPKTEGVPVEIIAAITAAISVCTGPHRILHITETSNTWSKAGRNAQHTHQPR